MYLVISYIICHVTYAFSYSVRNCTNTLQNEEIVGFENGFEATVVDCNRHPYSSRTSDWPFYWIYFTNWSWTVFVVSFFFDTSLTMMRFREQKQCLTRKLEENCTVIRPVNSGNFFQFLSILIFFSFGILFLLLTECAKTCFIFLLQL
jgi:hypothetical protein